MGEYELPHRTGIPLLGVFRVHLLRSSIDNVLYLRGVFQLSPRFTSISSLKQLCETGALD